MVNCFTIRDTIHKEQNELIAESLKRLKSLKTQNVLDNIFHVYKLLLTIL